MRPANQLNKAQGLCLGSPRPDLGEACEAVVRYREEDVQIEERG